MRVIATIAGKSAFEIGVKPGSTLAPHATAQGKLLLAFGGEAAIERVLGEVAVAQHAVDHHGTRAAARRDRADPAAGVGDRAEPVGDRAERAGGADLRRARNLRRRDRDRRFDPVHPRRPVGEADPPDRRGGKRISVTIGYRETNLIVMPGLMSASTTSTKEHGRQARHDEKNAADLTTRVGTLTLKNPLIAAAGRAPDRGGGRAPRARGRRRRRGGEVDQRARGRQGPAAARRVSPCSTSSGVRSRGMPSAPMSATIATRSGLTPQPFDAWLEQTARLDREAAKSTTPTRSRA